MFLNNSIGVTKHFCHAPPRSDASQILSQAPLPKRNDTFHKPITNSWLFAQIQLGSILTHSQVDFQEHSKVSECELLVGFSAGIMFVQEIFQPFEVGNFSQIQ